MSGHNVLQSIAATNELEIIDPGAGGIIQVDRIFGICSVEEVGFGSVGILGFFCFNSI